jgi:hypothetical protein
MAARKDRGGFDLISDAPPFGPAVGMRRAEFFLLFHALEIGRFHYLQTYWTNVL